MRLILTRAWDDAARTAAALDAMGHEVLLSPVISYEATGASWGDTPVPDGLIATSARAFTCVPSNAVSLAGWHGVPLYLVGRRTEIAARKSGFSGPASTGRDSAALREILYGLPPSRFTYFAGTDRKSEIEDAIASRRRHHLTLVETYRAVAASALAPEALAALHADEACGVLHFSRRSAEIFLFLARSAVIDARRLRHFCLSPDVAAPLREIACDDIHVASRPDEAALLALLRA